ncbi:MAG: serine/threonine protein kinase [Deltaproteobacteria bacterium]|nr:serine/threonine protein kinase [Deltaproteobacteria bacterium]
MSAEFGNYQITKKLAVGGMAEIYLARHRSVGGFERNVVLKKILPELADDPNFVESFLNEAKLAAQLNHSNIVQIYDLGMVGRSYFIAMEYIKGYDLSTILRAARKHKILLPVSVAVSIGRDFLNALDYAHNAADLDGRSLGIVHRDVTPSNILLTSEGQAKVVDFGIAKATAKQEGRTRTGTVKGKLSYLAPEQVLGRDIDRRVDVFSSSIVLYELITLVNPFRGDNDYATLRNIVEHTPRALQEVRRDVPPGISEPIVRGLSADRDQRFASCGELVQALERAAANAGIVVSSTEVRRFILDHKAALDAIVEKDREHDEEFTVAEASREIEPAKEAAKAQAAPVTDHPKKKPRRLPLAIAAFVLLAGLFVSIGMLIRPSAPVAPADPAPTVVPQPPAPPPVVTPPPEKAIERATDPEPERGSKKKHADRKGKKEPRVDTGGPPGKVRFIVKPWGEVEVDGKSVGLTPLPPMDLPAGTHKVVIRNSELGKTVTKTLLIESGKQSEVRHSFE